MTSRFLGAKPESENRVQAPSWYIVTTTAAVIGFVRTSVGIFEDEFEYDEWLL